MSVLNKLMAGETLEVRLKNVYTGEYLYAGDEFQVRDNDRRSIFTWREAKEKVEDWANWKIAGKFSDGTFKVQLSSKKFKDEPLYVQTEKEYLYDAERRNVFTSRTKSPVQDESDDWFMETDVTETAKNPDRYTLKNVLTKEYLYAAQDVHAKDASRRRVFTWVGTKKDFISNKQHMWDLEIM